MDNDPTTLVFIFVGLGAVATGIVGILLPRGDRLSAFLALVVGAGVGLLSLAIGFEASSDPPDDFDRTFEIAAGLGLGATLLSLGLLWRWTRDNQ